MSLSSSESSSGSSANSTSDSSDDDEAFSNVVKNKVGKSISLFTQSKPLNSLFVGDSGASHVMVNSLENLTHVKKPKNDLFISCANASKDARLPIEAKGTIKIAGEDSKIIRLDKVLFAENLSTNLLSLGRLCDQGFDILLTSTECFVIQKI